MTWLTDPLAVSFMQRALLGGSLAAVICAVVGTWVVVRGLAFLGEAVAHGMLPGVAVAALAGWPLVLGAAVSAGAMSVGVGVVARRARLSHDTATGLLFVGMLSLGVVIVSRSRSFATDLTAILFGDVLAVRVPQLTLLAVALVLIAAACAVLHRAFVALSFDPRTAATLGLRPRAANAAMVLLVTAAVVASFQALGTLLVLALLLAPAAAARQWTHRVPPTMALGAAFGVAAVLIGLLVSWHAGTAGGASIAGCAVALVLVSAAVRAAVPR
ncbi:zinc ABC transporter permease AztB [Modestobacter versicolor]|uniref:zinc ABC transporter permease AztB n=1 Tax=Modestobacter versicolor TaxID=429133 RepID=UPI0034DEA907